MDMDEELFKAVNTGDHKRVLELIRKGAKVNATNGLTPLYCAVRRGHQSICETLLKHGANPNVYRFGSCPLKLAIEKGNEKMVLLLLENGAELNHWSVCIGNTPLDKALHLRDTNACERMLTLLMDHGADVNKVNGKRTPLHWACENRDKDVVELLLHKGANIDALDAHNKTPVEIAQEKGYVEIVNMIEKQYPLWLQLYHACERGVKKECQTLLEQGALVDSSQYGLYCPVAAACEKGRYGIVQLLLEKRSIVNNKDNNERNALYLATKNGYTLITSLLLDNGASPHVKVHGDTLLHVAARNDDSYLGNLFIQRELTPNAKDHQGNTPLHYAVAKGNEGMVNFLIKNYANVNLANKEMQTPLHLACEGGHTRIVDILVKNGANTEALNEQKEKPTDIIEKKAKTIDEIKTLLKGPTADKNTQYSLRDASTIKDDDSDSDATVDYAVNASDCNKSKLKSRILDSEDMDTFEEKMARLSSLVVELNEKVLHLELTEIDWVQENEVIVNLNRKIEKTRQLKGLKGKNSEAKLLEDAIQDLTCKVEESEQKQAQLKEKVKGLQTEIQQLKITLKNTYLEISRYIK